MTRLDELIKEYDVMYRYPTIFLSGAMTGLTEKEQKCWREYLKGYLRDIYLIIDPTVFDAEDDNEETQRLGHDYDLSGIINCNYFVVNLNKAAQSVGTCQEIMFAWLLKKPILGFWESKECAQILHPWIKNKLSNQFLSIDALKLYLQLMYYKRKARELKNE